jgi:hypothetical protein
MLAPIRPVRGFISIAKSAPQTRHKIGTPCPSDKAYSNFAQYCLLNALSHEIIG